MSDFPEEITELATEIYAAMRDGESEEATAKLSRALLSAEARGMERAAKIADRTVNDNQCKNKFHSGGRTAAVLIAMRIRKEASDA